MNVRLGQCKRALSPSRLPGLDWAINPYRGCAHACSYCYAQDVTRFEMSTLWGEVVEVKVDIVSRLRKEIERSPRGVYGIGTVTDPYQPLERKYELTRGCLAVLRREHAKASLLTKSDLVVRDSDLLSSLPEAEVGISIGSLDEGFASIVERNAPSPRKRLEALSKLTNAGIRTYLMAAPIIPGLSDSPDSLVSIVREASAAGVKTIMWDKFNPKPMASARLKARLNEQGLVMGQLHTLDWQKTISGILRSECRKHSIELLDAF